MSGDRGSFNGATAFQPWKYQRPAPGFYHAAVLQWGHGLSAVEIFAAVAAKQEAKTLQWGHGLSAVEIARSKIHVFAHPRLQWGHGLSAVEIGARCEPPGDGEGASMGPRPFSRGNQPWRRSRRRPWGCFNGATAFQPWKSATQAATSRRRPGVGPLWRPEVSRRWSYLEARRGPGERSQGMGRPRRLQSSAAAA